MTSYSISLTVRGDLLNCDLDVWCTKSALLPPGVSLKSAAVALKYIICFESYPFKTK